MQLMTWQIARLGSRFGLVFEPYHRRVLHSALGRFLDQPLDLMVGLIEPDGTRRVLPFTTEGEPLFNPEQFERFNSITYRAFSEKYRLRFEFNIHSVFYPQREKLCVMPALYLEMRINPVGRVRWFERAGDSPQRVRLFLRLRRPDTVITASAAEGRHACIDLEYDNPLSPHATQEHEARLSRAGIQSAHVRERIISLNPGCEVIETDDGAGLECELPVTEVGSGTKWRLIWAAYTNDPVLEVGRGEQRQPAKFRYCSHWNNLEAVLKEAVQTRDERLALSRRFEMMLEQAPLIGDKRHLINQSFQSYLSNTFWCDVYEDGKARRPWFSVWEGSCFFHSTIDVEYNVALLYLSLWPQLLSVQFDQWAEHGAAHAPSGGVHLSHDVGHGPLAAGVAYPHPMEVEENCNFLLLLQTYTRWTGDLTPARRHADFIEQLTAYLRWADRDHSGFPSEGVSNTIDDASPATQFGRKQTYLAIKRAAALRAAADVLRLVDRPDPARVIDEVADEALRLIEDRAWLGDRYAVCIDKSAVGITDPWTGKPLPYEELPGWDAYSIYTSNGGLLPMIVGQPPLLSPEHMAMDLLNAQRECLSRYGCGHSSHEPDNVWVSQNLWRDFFARYLGREGLGADLYWDMQVMSNTAGNSKGFIDTYINNNLCFYPRGVVSMGYFLAGPRLIIDRLAPGGTYITVEPDRHQPQRWPLLPLADWRAGRIPICVVDETGRVTIEGAADPVIIRAEDLEQIVNTTGLIG